MQGARSAEPETYQVDRRGSEHRATQQMASAVVFQQPVRSKLFLNQDKGAYNQSGKALFPLLVPGSKLLLRRLGEFP